MATRAPFAIEEWYHCYNRGVDKRKTFITRGDYERFLLLMFVANSSKTIHVSDIRDRRLHEALSNDSLKRGTPIVEIGAYALMPNHCHLILREILPGGIARFMQKIFTGYTMYFNQKNERTGALFAGTFKSKHVGDDNYLKHLISYVHLNPAEIFDPKWKEKSTAPSALKKFLKEYPYSSLPEFCKIERPQKAFLSSSIFELFESIPSLDTMIKEARIYQTLQM